VIPEVLAAKAWDEAARKIYTAETLPKRVPGGYKSFNFPTDGETRRINAAAATRSAVSPSGGQRKREASKRQRQAAAAAQAQQQAQPRAVLAPAPTAAPVAAGQDDALGFVAPAAAARPKESGACHLDSETQSTGHT